MIYAERVTVSPENITLKPGEWYYGARAEVRPSYATCDCVCWRSSDPSVASVNKETGYIYARSAGHAVITAEAADGGGASDCFTVTVTTGEIPVWTLTLNYHDIKIKKGATFGLNVSINPWNATNKKLRWSSSNTSVATVNGSGVVTGISAGKATITVEPTDGSECCDMCTVTVEDNAHVTSVTVSPSRLDLAIGEFTYLHAEVCPCDGKDRCVTWSSEDQSIVAVNPDSGFIIARGSGTVKVYATATDGSGARGCCTVTVAAPISVTGIEVCPTSLTLNVCESATLKANVLPCNATNKLVTWSSSDDSVVKVVDIYNGGVLAKGVGSATLTATTADGGLTATCNVSISYCGGKDYRDLSKHIMKLRCDAYYRCANCGYTIKSPSLQDKSVLSDEDYYKVRSAYLSLPYYIQLEHGAELDDMIKTNALFEFIDDIRAKPEYDNRYEYSSVNGKCLREYSIAGQSDGIYMPMTVDVIDINDANIIYRNGFIEGLINLGIGIAVPKPYSYMFTALTTKNHYDTLSAFLSDLASHAGYEALGHIVGLISLGASTNKEMEVGDRLVRITFTVGAGIYISEVLYGNDGKLKMISHSVK